MAHTRRIYLNWQKKRERENDAVEKSTKQRKLTENESAREIKERKKKEIWIFKIDKVENNR